MLRFFRWLPVALPTFFVGLMLVWLVGWLLTPTPTLADSMTLFVRHTDGVPCHYFVSSHPFGKQGYGRDAPPRGYLFTPVYRKMDMWYDPYQFSGHRGPFTFWLYDSFGRDYYQSMQSTGITFLDHRNFPQEEFLKPFRFGFRLRQIDGTVVSLCQ